VRDGKVIPVGNYILIDPIIEETKHSFLIIPDAYKKKEGNKGVVVASNNDQAPAGAVVEYDPIGKFWNIIEGKRVYCMYDENIFLRYHEESDHSRGWTLL
jgi:hypothetical protein